MDTGKVKASVMRYEDQHGSAIDRKKIHRSDPNIWIVLYISGQVALDYRRITEMKFEELPQIGQQIELPLLRTNKRKPRKIIPLLNQKELPYQEDGEATPLIYEQS